MVKNKVEWRFKVRAYGWNYYHFSRTLHSFTDVDEVEWCIWFLRWRFTISKIGKGVLKKYL